MTVKDHFQAFLHVVVCCTVIDIPVRLATNGFVQPFHFVVAIIAAIFLE